MRRTLVLLLALCAAVAQEDPKARARELELQAAKALDEGRRGDALKLLADAADAREGMTKPSRAAAALAEMDAALKRGDAPLALEAGRRAQEALAAWTKDLEAPRPLAELPVEERLDRLAKQIEALATRLKRP